MQEMLYEFISEEASDMDVVGQAESAEDALDLLDELEVDVALIDVSLPKMTGIELVRKMQDCRPNIPCLLYTGHGESAYVERALDAGAHGYLLKGSPHELIDAIEQIAAGNTYISEELRT